MMKEALFAAALTFHPWHGDVEEPAARQERLEVIAQAIDEAVQVATCQSPPPSREGGSTQAPRVDEGPRAKEDANAKRAGTDRKPCTRMWSGDPRVLGFLLLAQAYFETHLARHVHEGKCRAHIGECDSGRAISLWQLQAGPHLPKAEWETLGGSDLGATRLAALEATRALSRGANYCGTLRGAIGLYATGQTCNWKPAVRREAFVRGLLARF